MQGRGSWRLFLVNARFARSRGRLETRAGSAALARAVAVLLLMSSAQAFAKPNKSECIAAFDRAQRARTDGKLRQARTDLLVCTQESCSAVLRADCSGVLQSVESALPTVVFAADDGDGHDITDVKVYVGSNVIASAIDGRAIELDPGTYDFRFEGPEARVITVRHVVKEGEKARSVRASFPSPKKPAPVPNANVSSSPNTTPLLVTRSTAGYVVPIGLAAVGVLALGFAGYSRLQFDGDVDDMRTRCAPECTQSERADLSSTLVTSNVSLGIGIGALALALVSWFVFQPTTRTSSARGDEKPGGDETQRGDRGGVERATSGFPAMIGRLARQAAW